MKSTAKAGERAGAADTAERGVTHLGVISGGLGALGLLRKQMWVVVGVQRALRREQHGRRGQEELTRR